MLKSYGLRKRIEPVRNCRKIGKKDMKYNDSMPKMRVDPETYVSHSIYDNDGFDVISVLTVLKLVEANGVACKSEPSIMLPLTQQFYIY